MKILRADIGHSGQIHKTLLEAHSDWGVTLKPEPGIWLVRFMDPTFFCFLLKHGKAVAGMAWGTVNPFYAGKLAEIEGLFVRRVFKKDQKATRMLAVALKDFLSENEVKKIIKRKASKEGLYELVEV